MNINKLFVAFAIFLPVFSASASVSLTFEAGAIRADGGSTVPLNSIGVLVADTTGDGFGTSTSIVGSTLSMGSSLGGSDNQIIAVFTATDLGSGLIGFYDFIDYTYSGTFAAGNKLALYWFPTITSVGVTIGTGVNYGYYRTDSIDGASGSDIAFVAPADGSGPSLAVFDNVTSQTITGMASLASPADLTALSYTAIPEPTSLALLATGGLLVTGTMLRRRRKIA